MAAGRVERGVVDAAEVQGAETGAVDDDAGGLAGVVEARGGGDVGEDGAAEDNALGEESRGEVGEVERRVDADGGESRAAIAAGGET